MRPGSLAPAAPPPPELELLQDKVGPWWVGTATSSSLGSPPIPQHHHGTPSLPPPPSPVPARSQRRKPLRGGSPTFSPYPGPPHLLTLEEENNEPLSCGYWEPLAPSYTHPLGGEGLGTFLPLRCTPTSGGSRAGVMQDLGRGVYGSVSSFGAHGRVGDLAVCGLSPAPPHPTLALRRSPVPHGRSGVL
jgi:hypothetical protein